MPPESHGRTEPADSPALAAAVVDLLAIRARAEAATEGPWRNDADTPWGSKVIINESGEMYVGVNAFTAVPTDGWSDAARARAAQLGANKCADATFIAHARSDVPALLALVDSLTVQRDDARGIAAALEAELARNGICGHLAPTLAGGTVLPVCELRAGHDGWHEADDGCKWSEPRTDLAEREQT